VRLAVVPGALAVCRLAADAPLADWMDAGAFSSVTRTPDELSVVCAEAAVPEGITAERGWRALHVDGPLDFAMTGVLARLAAPLAEAGVPIFVVSTFDTDWLLVKAEHLARAVGTLRQSGHEVQTTADDGLRATGSDGRASALGSPLRLRPAQPPAGRARTDERSGRVLPRGRRET